MSSTNPTDKAKTIEEVFCFGFEDPTFINDIHVLVGKDKIETAKAQLESIMQDYAIEVIDIIACHEGWEDSRDFYAQAFGSTHKYRDWSNSPEFEGFRNRLEQLRTTNQALKGEE